MGLFSKKPEKVLDRRGNVIVKGDLNAIDKPLKWFDSEDGITALKEYTKPQNYLLQEKYRKQYDELSKQPWALSSYIQIFHKDVKAPCVYFGNLLGNFKVRPLNYSIAINYITDLLCLSVMAFDIDEDGEPKHVEPKLTLEKAVSLEKNPLLYFASKFDFFDLKDDDQGTFDDKWTAYSLMLKFLVIQAVQNDAVITENPWILEKSTYFNEMDTVRKEKGFLKKCIELSGENSQYFEIMLKRLEDNKQ
jgi:hypothetical protein